MRRAWLVLVLLAPLLGACAPPLECHRSSGDVWCELSAWQRRRPLLHGACRSLGGIVEGMQNELGREIGDQHCRVDVWIPKWMLQEALAVLVVLLVLIRLRRRWRA